VRCVSPIASEGSFVDSSSLVTPEASGGSTAPRVLDRRGQVYEPAISPRLKYLLAFIFVSFALLGATGAYTASISVLNWLYAPKDYTKGFTLDIVLLHTVFGAFFILPFIYFGVKHWSTARKRPNRRAVRLGIMLFWAGVIVCGSGLVLVQLSERFQLPTGSVGRWVAYVLHVAVPVVAVVIYVQHRRAGPDIQWKWGAGWGVSVGLFVAVMIWLHAHDPRKWYLQAPKEGDQYFEPSLTRTVGGTFVSAETFMMDEYCLKCHQDIYNSHLHSAHKFSSFNNPAYLFSVRETRKVALKRDGNTRASRWCAGCHDPVPFLSGQFDDPNFDDVKNPTAHAGITCTVCHAMTHVNSAVGNGDYVIEEPEHYPFARSQNRVLQWLNNQLVKAKPEFHKKTFLKPFHKTAEFCSTCHKVSLPMELNQYKEFLRGQNHYDTYLLSGVSGVGARSFYYPAVAKKNCAECHMPLTASNDFGSKNFDGSGTRKIHNHLFPAANTGLPWLLSLDTERTPESAERLRQVAREQADFLRGTDEAKDRKMRIDLLGMKEGGTIDGKLHLLRPELPRLQRGKSYLVEVVVRTLNLGHPFTQGTADSNEVWVDCEARSGPRIIGRNGGLYGPDRSEKLPDRSFVTLEDRKLDEWAHRLNVLMLDRHGNRINRRNPQDIFTPLYDHQIGPGAAQVVHYALTVPPDASGPVELKVRLRYRKFDHEYMSLVHEGKVPKLPIVDLCEDAVTLPVEGVSQTVPEQTSPIPAWQRWNDYGIGCFLEGGIGSKKGEFRQAEEAFKQVLALNVPESRGLAFVNLARVYFDEGRLREAADALNQARECEPKAPWWNVAWFSSLVNFENGQFDLAIDGLEKILAPGNQPHDRKFDFGRDYVVINKLGDAFYKRALASGDDEERELYLKRAVARYQDTLKIDPENVDAHYGLKLGYTALAGDDTDVASRPGDVEELAARFAEGKRPTDERLAEGRLLAATLRKLAEQPTDLSYRKQPLLERVARQVKPLIDESDGRLRTQAAVVLALVHHELHAIFKPDDNARDLTAQLYKAKNPAAAAASEAIVIYSLHRQGAPGLDEP
jgi:tetratricopeptide (TPR) repeat protein